MIKALIFDMGGVLIDLNFQRCLNAFLGLGFEQIREMLDPCHQKGAFRELEAGNITADDFYDICITNSRPGTTKEDVKDCFRAFVEGIEPYKVPLLHELAEKYDLYMLSNNNPIAMSIYWPTFAEAGLPLTTFRELFISCDMKMLKPFPEIYRESIRRVGCKPSEMLFIDDSQSNVDAARAEGMNAVLFVQGGDLRKCIYDALEAIDNQRED